ncbi:hypothetical protein ACQBAR_09255 [Propionibacteriaceae bacterium Y1685]|uniref:hypothetical protein n=1 Tax=Microlunatus sp. Y1700 TaxID=3418487 RepID=UPI003B760C51
MITQHSITSATGLLQSGPGLAQAQQETALEVLDQTLSFGNLVDNSLLDVFVSWILGRLDGFQELLDSLDGDPTAIRQHSDSLTRAADRVDAVVGGTRSVTTAVVLWTGPAAEGFRKTSTATRECIAATATTMRTLAARHLTLGSMLATVKTEVMRLITDLASLLSRNARSALIKAGLRLVGHAWILAAATASGAAKGGLKGAWNGFKKAGPVGAVFGGTKGAVEGGVTDAKAEFERRKNAALNEFIGWAGGKVSEVISRTNRYVNDSLRPMVHQIGEITGEGNRMERATSLLTTGRDPGNASDAAAKGTAGDTIKGKHAQAKDRDLIKLNQAIGKPDAELPPGYRRASDEDLRKLGLTRSDLTDENGFASEVFIAPDGSAVVAFAGTGSGDVDKNAPGAGSGPDTYEDGVGGFTVSPQTEQVMKISKAVSASPNGDDVVFTGHSLGGRHAATAAMMTGNGAVTYNAAGVSPATVDHIAASSGRSSDQVLADANNGQVRRYYTGDDPLTAAQERNAHTKGIPDAVGAPVQLSPDAGDLGDVRNTDEYGEGHGQDNVEREWNEKYGPRSRRGPELVGQY